MVLVIAAPCASIGYAVYEMYVELYSPPPLDGFRTLETIYLASVVWLFSAAVLVCYVLVSLGITWRRRLHATWPDAATAGPR